MIRKPCFGQENATQYATEILGKPVFTFFQLYGFQNSGSLRITFIEQFPRPRAFLLLGVAFDAVTNLAFETRDQYYNLNESG
jgi:hypothetical protein